MRKCHYIYDKEVGRVLIPNCYTVVHSNDIRDCTCRGYSETFEQFEKEEYNKKLKEKNEYIKELEKENARLTRILKKVNGFR